jgi:hypothetical protein
MITADLTKNLKQSAFFDTVMMAVFGDSPLRYLFYGGAIRGGKTFACLICLIMFCRMFPGSKWYVIRKDFTRLQETTLPSMLKILRKSPHWRWNRDRSNYYVEYMPTGSKIFFAGEDFVRDPKLNWLLGLECNGFFLEQVEELQEYTLEMCISRAGSEYIDPMPTPIILASMNPTITWVRERIWLPWSEGRLAAPYYFLEALPDDNAFVTEEQWAAWENLPDEMYAQFIEASWEFAKPPNVFAFAFDEKKHHKDVGYNSDFPLYASFDFNVEPITCLLEQHDIDWVHTFKEYRLLPSDIWALSEHLIANHGDAFWMVTGDATGQARQAISRGNKTYYQVIKQQLILGPTQIRVPKANPSVRNTRVLTNALLAKHPNFWINTKACPHLTLDLNGVVMNQEGDIDKSSDKRKTHLLDCFRYNNWTWHRDFLDKSLYQYLSND